MQNTMNEDSYADTNTYTRTEGIGNQTPPRFENNNLPVGTFPPEMLNHKKPKLRMNTSSKSLINRQGADGFKIFIVLYVIFTRFEFIFYLF
jgi:hypothetical protein